VPRWIRRPRVAERIFGFVFPRACERQSDHSQAWMIFSGQELSPLLPHSPARRRRPPPDAMVMKKAEAYLNKARGPNLFELTGICTGRAHWFWCAPRLFPTSFHPDHDDRRAPPLFLKSSHPERFDRG
jgi:hypothetical protein